MWRQLACKLSAWARVAHRQVVLPVDPVPVPGGVFAILDAMWHETHATDETPAGMTGAG